MTTAPSFVYLASQSPRRGQLLDQIGVRHRLLLPLADEDAEALEAERAGEPPAAYVERVTLAKLKAAGARLMAAGLPPAPILCADTTVALGRRIFGKPRDAAEAVATLRLLSGRTHLVITAVAVAVARDRLNAFDVPGGLDTADKHEPPREKKAHESHDMLESLAVSRSSVRFGVMPAAAIDAYVASGEPFGKAGAYAIQGAIAGWIERIDGSYSGIMGLPLFETAHLLRRAGIDC